MGDVNLSSTSIAGTPYGTLIDVTKRLDKSRVMPQIIIRVIPRVGLTNEYGGGRERHFVSMPVLHAAPLMLGVRPLR